ncbi:mycothiol S-conjugate amidase [Cryobacterium mesophilum]|uniref:Mycothiol S-conjugate amidase n=1 Tax=Terrimesophilobacter mesophilus TaxID=433647 RepID=A0A4R8VAZ9_9MICO|nr:mycothiol conjugate amidase Mca [Terrimesophilobacter mesophilus]MBB5633771.1 mycothiol S-conjugate amidase [Terrimesophilobacter mesophilus]TFB80451.1 mycothiol conjugate amidase Mca [Terrimesophilobacter mesophilus]
MSRRLLAVHAHPDDESSKGAATYAHYVHAGAEVMVVSCTGGERGDVQNPGLVEMAMAERDMAGLRHIEMARARDIIGFEHRWLGFEDSGLPEEGEALPPNCFALIPLEYSAEPLVAIIRTLRPQVMITYDEAGGYPHPDHVRTHELSMYAMAAAADPNRYPDAGPAWQIQKVYYDRIFNSPRANAMYDALKAKHPDSPLLEELDGYRSWMRERPDLATTHIEVGEFFSQRDAALKSHASQVAPDSSFFFWPNDLQREVWPWEDYQLATSLVHSELPESDLFAGITADVEPE